MWTEREKSKIERKQDLHDGEFMEERSTGELTYAKVTRKHLPKTLYGHFIYGS